ncbi:MAG: transposase family protein, partial [Armatimonadetes bacterium]|nr:transposase family protein [Armatimonadota bacterium]
QDARRFAYPHRLDMILSDGKHFRAGPTRARRVVLFFLDDATRFPLHAVVGTSENAPLFLRGLYEAITKYGLMSGIYLDHGPGFIAADTIYVVASLGAALIHGKKAYPEGHGKIERFNRTVLNDLLRGLSGRPDVDPDPRALELRINHYLEAHYSQRPHESLNKEKPYDRFHGDDKNLDFPEDHEALRAKFEVTLSRRVSSDNVVSVSSVSYDVPRGYKGQRVQLRRKLLGAGGIFFLHEGRLMELHPTDLAANARAKRARGNAHKDADPPPRTSAADLAYQRDYGSVVDADGGYSNPNPQEEP